ncbi:hypothetical protein [Phaeobacter sp. 22II1-1F12B]|uniref:hypothetical protein n=1 Tax=Phaeobacter sp. 22II1-1F12B TaxID=1317111 RepID=UPI000B6FFB8E|nr:hypothetical protein [Phaeobacter sp. 22II1-1F12B]OWU80454.1 hypothetical protein ATO1_08905 [Phaeobacter sp. 22II1-1F12B]
MTEPDILMIRTQIDQRAAALRKEAEALEALSPAFIRAIADAQIEANKGWRPDGKTLVDVRVHFCPECGAPGLNTCWGYWAHVCGAGFDSEGYTTRACDVQLARKQQDKSN